MIDVKLGENMIGFFGAAPVGKASVADPSAVTCTTGTYATAAIFSLSTNVATQVEALTTDVAALRTKLAEVVDRLQELGLN